MFGLNVLYPLFLAAAAAVAIPIALHLFRRKTERVVDFPAVRLLRKGPVEQHRRRRLRELLLLALRVTALALLAFAFSRPYFDEGAGALPAPVSVIALDISLSLSAPGQWEAARAHARRAVDEAPSTHAVALMTFADSATVVVPPTTDRGGVLAAIDAAKAAAGATRYRTALARAAEVIGGATGRIVVVSDLQQSGWEAGDEGAVPDGIRIEVSEVPAPPGNVAVTAVRRDGAAVIAAIHNYGARPIRLPVHLRVADKDVVTQATDIAAQSAAEVRLSATLPARGAASVVIDDAAGYQGDNQWHFVLDPPGAVSILVITAAAPDSSNAGLYIERALSVADDGRAFAPQVIDGRAFSSLSVERFGQPASLIVLGTTTLDRTGRQRIAAYLNEGGRVLVTLGPDVDLATLPDAIGGAIDVEPVPAAAARTATLVATDGRHPIFRPFLRPSGALGDVYIEQYRRLNDQSGRTVLARFSGAGNAFTEQPVGRGRLLLFASDLDNQWNRFPLNPSFVPWAIETARYLTHGREQRQDFVLPEHPLGSEAAPGVYQLSNPDRRVAVNVDVRESNPTRTTAEEFTGAIARLNQVAAVRAQAVAREQEDRQRLWQIGLLVMFVALAGEGLIGRSR
ncbi:MAG TPA: BatA and WFA domain-containing protein [Vicinamibacterales bacterium]|nr:BatA and WFA domain-containing protein [Vicinamibacterales bacterium]